MDTTHTALDTSVLESLNDVQPEGNDTPPQDTEPTVTPTEGEATATSDNPPPPVSEIELDGIGKVTLDEIKEWRQGNLRQSDYTKKTQELARQREELQEALEVYNYLQQNPHVVAQLKVVDESGVVDQSVLNATTPESRMLKEVWYNQKNMEIDNKLAMLKQKYGEVDEVALFNTAAQMRTDDLEFVYKAIAFDQKPMDQRALIEQAKAELRAELEKTKGMTSTIVSSAPSSVPTRPVNLSAAEARVAEGMGMTPSEYAKWRGK